MKMKELELYVSKWVNLKNINIKKQENSYNITF